MPDKREEERARVSVRIRFRSATVEEFIEQESADISRGGAFIKSKRPLPIGTLLKFELQLQDRSPVIRGIGRVAWRRESDASAGDDVPGMGIKFVKLSAESVALVHDIVSGRPSYVDSPSVEFDEQPTGQVGVISDLTGSDRPSAVIRFEQAERAVMNLETEMRDHLHARLNEPALVRTAGGGSSSARTPELPLSPESDGSPMPSIRTLAIGADDGRVSIDEVVAAERVTQEVVGPDATHAAKLADALRDARVDDEIRFAAPAAARREAHVENDGGSRNVLWVAVFGVILLVGGGVWWVANSSHENAVVPVATMPALHHEPQPPEAAAVIDAPSEPDAVGSEDATANEGDSLQPQAEIAQLPYVVRVITTPSDARVGVRGQQIARTPGELTFEEWDVPAFVIITKSGFRRVDHRISREDFEQTEDARIVSVVVTLERVRDKADAEEPAAERIPDQIPEESVEVKRLAPEYAVPVDETPAAEPTPPTPPTPAPAPAPAPSDSATSPRVDEADPAAPGPGVSEQTPEQAQPQP